MTLSAARTCSTLATRAKKTILISGASIAGPALALCLLKHGTYKPVIVERAPELRLGGQNVDLEGPAQEAAKLMGIEDAIRSKNTGELGVRIIDPTGGGVSAEFPVTATGSLTKEIEILRGDLSKILFERTIHDCEYMFGDYIESMQEKRGGVTVSFASGVKRDFDLVVAADGCRSRTRSLIVGNEPVLKPLGVYCAYFTIPRNKTDTQWARWYNAPNSRVMLLRPDNVGTTRVCLSFLSDPQSYETLQPQEVKEVLARVFADAGWEAPRVLEE
jgi:2-polyprenyl-6-methoxyphenol hydroxylase-like FAD-dependent oxidoreductase